MSITELRLKNFQRHIDLKLLLSPGVTAIIGASDTGKSAIVRALRWVVEHKPITGLQTHGTEDTRVGIKTDAGTVIRFKDKKEYGYLVNGKKFLATASVQPVGVKQILGMEPINFQGQHDPVFLLSLTPGQMAKELNRIVNLGAIDVAVAEVNARIHRAKVAVEVWEGNVKDNQKIVDALAWVADADADLSALEAKVKKYEDTESQARKLHIWRERAEITRQKISTTSERLEAIVPLVEKYQEYAKAAHKASTLRKILSRSLDLIDRETLDTLSKAVVEFRQQCQSRQKFIAATQFDRNKLHQLLKRLQELALEILAAEGQKLELENKIKEIPKCPTCGKAL